MEIKLSTTDQDLENIYNYDFSAFIDSVDFDWDLQSLKKIHKEGWKIYSVIADEQIIAALFLKVQGKSLLTKNTPIKLSFQGKSYSHQIKDFYEKKAKQSSLAKIYHYCRKDDFRMVSLNKSCGYSQTDSDEYNNFIEWEKDLQNKNK